MVLKFYSVEEVRQQFETNVFGVFKVTKAFLPYFRERKDGKIVFISSLVAWVGHPFGGAYSGSKFALEGMVAFIIFINCLHISNIFRSC